MKQIFTVNPKQALPYPPVTCDTISTFSPAPVHSLPPHSAPERRLDHVIASFLKKRPTRACPHSQRTDLVAKETKEVVRNVASILNRYYMYIKE